MQETPAVAQWWPSSFGEADELGMLNHVTPAKRVEALGLVSAGRLYDLGRVLDEHVPVFPGRAFHQTLVTTAHHTNMGGVGENRVNWITEVISGTTQLGTHLDALSGCDTWSYGPVPAEDPARPFEVPQVLNVHHGVFVVENLDTSALAADGVREFALVLTHPKLRGATGAWVSPIALV